MPVVRYKGDVPASIAEGSGPSDWVANIQLEGDLSHLAAVETTGPAAAFFSASWNASLGTATVRPAAALDFEAFSAAGALPEVKVALQFVFDDGSRQAAGPGFEVAVLDRDDTPPVSLAFDPGGGTVEAGAIGVPIGALSVVDPDSAGPFRFSFAPEDDWRFEVVGGVLKLRDGISLGLDDVPVRPVLVEVSDGSHSAAFLLEVAVTAPAETTAPAPQAPPPLAAGETHAGFTLVGMSEALTTRPAQDASDVAPGAGGARHVVFDNGDEVWLGPVDRVRFADGWLGPAAEGPAAEAAALHRAVLGHDADGVALAPTVAELRAGAGWSAAAQDLLDAAPSLAALDDAGFVSSLYRSALGTPPASADLALHTARLASGAASRAQVAADIALSPAALARVDGAAPAGHWVADPFDPASDPPARPTFHEAPPAAAHGPHVEAGWFM